MSQVHEIRFHGARLFGVRTDDAIMIPIKPICEAMAIDWNGQFQRINRDRILAEGMCVTHIPFGAGGAQDAACLPLHLLNYWLATVDANRIRDDAIRERVWLYKRECAAVLAAYFITGKVPDRPDVTATLLQDDLFAEPSPRHGSLTERVDRLEGDFGEVKKAATEANVNSMLAVKLAQAPPMRYPQSPADHGPGRSTASGLPPLAKPRGMNDGR